MIGGIIGHNFEDTLSPTLVYTSPVISEKIFEKNLRRRTPRDSENLCGLWVIELDKVRKLAKRQMARGAKWINDMFCEICEE